MEKLIELHAKLKKIINLEINLLRDTLSLIHQAEYAILAGDKDMQLKLGSFSSANHKALSDLSSKRHRLIEQILEISSPTDMDLPTFLATFDEDGCETSTLFEHLNLLEERLKDQTERNQTLSKAIDKNQKLPDSDALQINPIYSEKRKKPIMLAVDYPPEPPQKEE